MTIRFREPALAFLGGLGATTTPVLLATNAAHITNIDGPSIAVIAGGVEAVALLLAFTIRGMTVSKATHEERVLQAWADPPPPSSAGTATVDVVPRLVAPPGPGDVVITAWQSEEPVRVIRAEDLPSADSSHGVRVGWPDEPPADRYVPEGIAVDTDAFGFPPDDPGPAPSRTFDAATS